MASFEEHGEHFNLLPRPAQTPTEICTEKSSIRAYGVSDLHAESANNYTWVLNKCVRKSEDSHNCFTIFILPGDVSSSNERILQVFTHLVAMYDAVCFVPGNHEAWATKGSRDSVEKLREIHTIATSVGVHVHPIRVVSAVTNAAVTICSLYSWYHSSFDIEPDIQHQGYKEIESSFPFTERWSDFAACKWPIDMVSHSEFASTSSSSVALAEAFAKVNEEFLGEISKDSRQTLHDATSRQQDNDEDDDENGINLTWKSVKGNQSTAACTTPSATGKMTQTCDTVISFSHFLPRIECIPEKRFIADPQLARVSGSNFLEMQIRKLQPHLHMFGHTHIPIDLEIDGIAYVQWPLGYQREATLQCAPIQRTEPMLVCDTSLGSGKDAIPPQVSRPSSKTYWSQYYHSNERHADVVEPLAPWVLSRISTYKQMISR